MNDNIVKARVEYPSIQIRYVNFEGVTKSIRNGQLVTKEKYDQKILKELDNLGFLIDVEYQDDEKFYVVYLGEDGKPKVSQVAMTESQIERYFSERTVINRVKQEAGESYDL